MGSDLLVRLRATCMGQNRIMNQVFHRHLFEIVQPGLRRCYPDQRKHTEILTAGGLPVERTALKRQVDGALEQFELEVFADRNVKALSYGQFRRVLIARAVVHTPKVLLLDEPWEGLDAGNLDLVTRELNQIIERGSQLICATHVAVNGARFNREMRIEKGHIVSMTS